MAFTSDETMMLYHMTLLTIRDCGRHLKALKLAGGGNDDLIASIDTDLNRALSIQAKLRKELHGA